MYFLKQGKSTCEPKSYRSIYLLPTVDKLLEKLSVLSLTFFLESNNLLHPRQFGFRDGRSCEKTLLEILTSCTDRMSACDYTSLVSIDIQGAIDKVKRRDILTQLQLPGKYRQSHQLLLLRKECFNKLGRWNFFTPIALGQFSGY